MQHVQRDGALHQLQVMYKAKMMYPTWVGAALWVSMVGCAAADSGSDGPEPSGDAGHVAYYSGTSASFSPDGKIPYHKTDVILKRAVSKGGIHIVETWTRPAPSPSMAPEVRVMRLVRRGESLVYDASGEGKPCSGTVVFLGADLDAWTLDLDLGGGQRATGTGRLGSAGVTVTKALIAPRPMRVVEELRPVGAGAYEQELASMRPPRHAE